MAVRRTPVTADVDPWDQQRGESPAAFQAFALYRDQPARRSRRQVAIAAGKAPSLISKWQTRWAWVARARLYDAELEGQARAAHERQILDFRLRAVSQARGKAQTMMLPDMAISAKIERARGAGQDLPSMFEGVTMVGLIWLAIGSARALPALLKAEADALGATLAPDDDSAHIGAGMALDVLTPRIEASDELRGLAAQLLHLASA